ncbi:MAG: hypothetical protein JWM84_2757 [Nocardioides sp.]|nr:hypothetical protein [Nocardioides sp.]
MRQPGGLEDLRDAVERAEGDGVATRLGRQARDSRGATASITSPAMVKRTARKSNVGTRSSRSLMRKNVEPQQAVIASRAAVASSVVRREPVTG